MADYPLYAVIIDREGDMPLLLGGCMVTGVDEAERNLKNNSYKYPDSFKMMWNTFFSQNLNKKGESSLDYFGRDSVDNKLKIVILRRWFNSQGECLCKYDDDEDGVEVNMDGGGAE